MQSLIYGQHPPRYIYIQKVETRKLKTLILQKKRAKAQNHVNVL